MKFIKRELHQPVVVSSQEVDAAVDQVNKAFEALLIANGPVEEAESVLNDCMIAHASIEKYGCQAANMSVFDHKGELSIALGREPLDLASLETLDAKAQELLKSEYSAGLEGLAKDAWNAFVKALENIVKALVEWFKRIFDKNTKYKAYIESNRSALDSASDSFKTASATVLAYADLEKCVKGYAACSKILGAAEGALVSSFSELKPGGEGAINEGIYMTKLAAASGLKDLEGLGVKIDGSSLTISEFPFKESEQELGKAGYDAAKGKSLCDTAIKFLNDPSLKKLAQTVDKSYIEALKEAKSAGDDEKKQAVAKAKKAIAGQAKQLVVFGNQLLGKVVFSAYTCCKAAKAPAKPAEGEKKTEEAAK